MKLYKSIVLSASILLMPTAVMAKPQGWYAGAHYGAIDAQPASEGPGINLGYQGDGGWGVHGEFTRDTVGTFGGVFATYRTSGDIYLLFKGGAAGGRSASGLAGGLGVGGNLGSALNLELDANSYGGSGVAHLRLSYSF